MGNNITFTVTDKNLIQDLIANNRLLFLDDPVININGMKVCTKIIDINGIKLKPIKHKDCKLLADKIRMIRSSNLYCFGRYLLASHKLNKNHIIIMKKHTTMHKPGRTGYTILKHGYIDYYSVAGRVSITKEYRAKDYRTSININGDMPEDTDFTQAITCATWLLRNYEGAERCLLEFELCIDTKINNNAWYKKKARSNILIEVREVNELVNPNLRRT